MYLDPVNLPGLRVLKPENSWVVEDNSLPVRSIFRFHVGLFPGVAEMDSQWTIPGDLCDRTWIFQEGHSEGTGTWIETNDMQNGCQMKADIWWM